MDETTVGVQDRPPHETAPGWTPLVDAAARSNSPRLPTPGRVVARFLGFSLVAIALLLTGSLWASGIAARGEGLADARQRTDTLARLLVIPILEDERDLDDPGAREEMRLEMDRALGDRLRTVGMVRVKIWTPDGTILYSDERQLIDQHFGLDEEELQALADGQSRAELSDLRRRENIYERSFGQLLEVYRKIETGGGQDLLLETYSPYDEATSRQLEIWWTFAPITIAVVLALVAVQVPLAYRMVGQLRAVQRERELLQLRALDSSTEERRRIAGSLHDGIVQDVSASSLLVAGAADQLRDDRTSSADVAETLNSASAVLRESVGSLRSLLVEIYPPSLARAGLPSVLADLAARLRSRGIEVTLVVPDDLELPLEKATLMFRTAQEALLNVVKHARARHVEVDVRQLPDQWVLTITDDGDGFDLAAVRAGPRPGHLGLNVLADLAAADGAALAVRTAPGAGTAVRLEVPRP